MGLIGGLCLDLGLPFFERIYRGAHDPGMKEATAASWVFANVKSNTQLSIYVIYVSYCHLSQFHHWKGADTTYPVE